MTTNAGALTFVSSAGPASRAFVDHISEYVYNVKSFGAVGDNSNDDTSAIQDCLDASFTDNTFQNWSFSNLTKLVYFPPGIYKTSSELVIPTHMHGGMIFGAGKGVSVINNITSGSIVINTDGFLNSTMRDMSLWSAGGAGSICYRWDENIYDGGSSTKECCWINVEFKGGEVGLAAGQNAQCDVSLVLNCFFHDHAHYGIWTRGGNTLSWVVQGGRFENCDYGIMVAAGNIPLIQGVYFDSNVTADIANFNEQSLAVIGCYFNSASSIQSIGATKVIGCTHTGAGNFVSLGGNAMTAAGTTPVCMDACVSSGNIRSFNPSATAAIAYARNCDFPANFFTAVPFAGTVKENF